MKLGRNDPCHCDSGLKYKKCCEDSDKERARNPARDETGRLVGREAIETEWPAQDKLVRAVGNRVYLADPRETRHEFFIRVLKGEFGKPWHDEQLRLPEEERHPVHQWWELYGEATSGEIEGVEIVQEDEHLFGMEMLGEIKALLCLGHDLYTLLHSGSLPTELVARVRHKDQFQGARYELAIAAVFVRAGYEIKWIRDTSRKLPEFIAKSGEAEIAVEAKSRHRPGTLGYAGAKPDPAALDADVQQLLKRALEKETDDRPFIVCLDLNLPTEQSRPFEEWISELSGKVLDEHNSEKTGEREPFSAVLFTNYSWHWDGQAPAGNPVQIVVRANTAQVPIPLRRLDPIAEAVFQYGDVPN